MSKYSNALQDQARQLLARSTQVHHLLEMIAEQSAPDVQDAIEGVAVLAGQLSEMAESLYSEVSKPTERELAEVRQLKEWRNAS
jgi:molybdopterin-guanine dinucleotide biosynthesis protein A